MLYQAPQNPQEKQAEIARLGERMRSARKKKKLRLIDVALAAGVTRQAVSMIELGQFRPSIVLLRRIAFALDTTTSVLLRGMQ